MPVTDQQLIAFATLHGMRPIKYGTYTLLTCDDHFLALDEDVHFDVSHARDNNVEVDWTEGHLRILRKWEECGYPMS